MNSIAIRGVIVPSIYDSAWTQDYIAKGIITPESFVRNAINAADPSQPLDVYINSPGGSVFSAYEIINALTAFRITNKQPVTITIGAMAASAASAISILSGAKIRVHRNSKLMFHGAFTETLGGSEAHEDTADLLDKINADIKTALVSKYNLAPETVNGWFAEGRAGWLTADDALSAGIADSVVDADAEPIEFADSDVVAIGEHGLAIAAFVGISAEATAEEITNEEPTDDRGESSDDSGGDQDGGESADEPNDEPETGAEAAEAAEEDEEKPSEPNIDDLVSERVEVILSDRTAPLMARIAELTKRVADESAKAKGFQSRYDQEKEAHNKTKTDFEMRAAEMRSALEKANARYTKLTIGSLSFSPAIESWEEALKACDGDYVTARKTYPEAYHSFMQSKGAK